MAIEDSPAWPQTTTGETDWETVFENPQTGFIALIVQARSPAALRQSTELVIKSIYAHDDAPPEIAGFVDKLGHMLPDDLPDSDLSKAITAITTVLREIKDDRIRQERDRANIDDFDDLDFGEDHDDDNASKKKAKKPRKQKKAGKSKKSKRRGGNLVVIFASLTLLLGLFGGGGYYYYVLHREPDLTRVLIDQMTQAAKGNSLDQHVFGSPLIVENRAGLTGVTVEGIPAKTCASIAWYFANRGNVLINDRMPEKASPNVLKNFCEAKGERAKLTWLSKQSPSADGE